MISWMLVACAHRPPEPAPGTVSPPVTLEEFRAAFPVGTTILVRSTSMPEPPAEHRWTWTAVDKKGGTIVSLSCDADGRPMGEVEENRAMWTELMSHAVFPADRTVRSDTSVEVPAGRFDTWLYTVDDTLGDGPRRVARYHFDRELPGPPVLFTREDGGVEVYRMELLDRKVGPPAPGDRCIPE